MKVLYAEATTRLVARDGVIEVQVRRDDQWVSVRAPVNRRMRLLERALLAAREVK